MRQAELCGVGVEGVVNERSIEGTLVRLNNLHTSQLRGGADVVVLVRVGEGDTGDFS